VQGILYEPAIQWELQRAPPPTDVVTSNSSDDQLHECGGMHCKKNTQQYYTTDNIVCTVVYLRLQRCWTRLGPRVLAGAPGGADTSRGAMFRLLALSSARGLLVQFPLVVLVLPGAQ